MTGAAALVTGGARRLGRVLALRLAASGWSVVVHFHHSGAEAMEVVRMCEDRGARAAAVEADLREAEAVERLAERAAEAAGGPLALLVNNASSFLPDSFEQPSNALDNIAVNLAAPLVLAGAFARQNPGAGEADRCIVNLLDAGAAESASGFASYAVAKAGLLALTRLAAASLAPRVRVNGIAPGAVLAGERQSREHFDRLRAESPLGRGAALEEVEEALMYLLSSRSVTGEVLTLDGGRSLVGS